MPQEIRPIPVDRVIEKLDSYFSKNDMSSAERHLRYWLSEAEAGNDDHGRLTVLNEQIGLYRKTENRERCLEAASLALETAERLFGSSSVSLGTTYINAATAYRAFGMPETALDYYRRAVTIYEAELSPSDGRLGSLYNNMGTALTSLRMFDEAENMFFKALDIMSQVRNGELECAITYLNLADLLYSRSSPEDPDPVIDEYLGKAAGLLNCEGPERNGYYAFVCEKCAPSFGFYGYFSFEQELKERARMIYERS